MGLFDFLKKKRLALKEPARKSYTIYTGGQQVMGCPYEEVSIKWVNGVWYYRFIGMTDPMNCGGTEEKVPEEYLTGNGVDEKALLRYIAKEYSMQTMDAPLQPQTK